MCGGGGSVRCVWCGGGYTSTYITILARTQRLGNIGFANLVHLKGFSPEKYSSNNYGCSSD